MKFEANKEFAEKLDQEDALAHFRPKYFIPTNEKGVEKIYFCGNSLGLQPKSVKSYFEIELEDWKNLAVEGHFEGRNPWFHYHKFFSEKEARLVGALPPEVVVMNALTVNLHLLMVSFYRPTKDRFKIMIEAGAFPSDQYAVESQARFHGFDPEEAILEMKPRNGDYTLKTEDILKTIDAHKNDLALVMFGGVNYYTGQFFDLPAITQKAHEHGVIAGFDLAHTTGNIPLKLHDWNVDFATWCTYKYLNSGPGGTSGVFIHEKYANDRNLPRFAGWWGYDEKTRFKMKKGFIPEYGAAGWQLSNAQVFNMVAHKAALDLFDEAGMNNLRQKSLKLTGFLLFLLENLNEEVGEKFKIITPKEENARGAQVSIIAKEKGKEIFNKLTQNDVVADWREPDVIRVAPVPMYNTFTEVFRFYEILREAL